MLTCVRLSRRTLGVALALLVFSGTAYAKDKGALWQPDSQTPEVRLQQWHQNIASFAARNSGKLSPEQEQAIADLTLMNSPEFFPDTLSDEQKADLRERLGHLRDTLTYSLYKDFTKGQSDLRPWFEEVETEVIGGIDDGHVSCNCTESSDCSPGYSCNTAVSCNKTEGSLATGCCR